MGQSVDQIAIQLTDLWQVGKLYLRATTVIIGASIMLATLWRHKDKLTKIISGRKNRKEKGNSMKRSQDTQEFYALRANNLSPSSALA